jgi:hypothetical protein
VFVQEGKLAHANVFLCYNDVQDAIELVQYGKIAHARFSLQTKSFL